MSEWLNISYWPWFGLAITLVIIELVISTNFFLIWLGIAACLTGLAKWLVPWLLWQHQVSLFSVISILSIAFWRYYLKKQLLYKTTITLNQKSQQLIGQNYILVEPILNGRGKIKIGDTVWSVKGPDLEKGSTVQVVGMEGTVLKVKPVASL